MSLAQAISNVSPSKNSYEQMNSEEKINVNNYLEILIDHLNLNGINLDTSLADASAGKLSKLTIHHLMDLASDMCDELNRRKSGSNLPLSVKKELNTKRNNARAKMAEFPTDKLNNLILEVVLEIKRRKIGNIIHKPLEEDLKKRSSVNVFDSSQLSDNICESPCVTKKTKSAEFSSQIKDISFNNMKNESIHSVGIFAGMDSLNIMIEDLGSLIERDDTEEINALKQKYENEILQLKESLNNYQISVIPDKNREISKLTTRIQEFDLLNVRLRKELISLNEQLSCKNSIIEDQKIAYDNLKECIDKIQNQIINRSDLKLSNARDAARVEFVSNNVFSDLDLNNSQISAAIGEIEKCISSISQKNHCLKLLRDIGTAAQSSLIYFDRILDVSRSFDMVEICKQGEPLKSSFIASLSLLIVSGKDFNARPDFSSEFKSHLESFKTSNNNFFNFKIQIENAFQNL